MRKKCFRYISKTKVKLKKLSAYSGSATYVYPTIDLTPFEKKCFLLTCEIITCARTHRLRDLKQIVTAMIDAQHFLKRRVLLVKLHSNLLTTLTKF